MKIKLILDSRFDGANIIEDIRTAYINRESVGSIKLSGQEVPLVFPDNSAFLITHPQPHVSCCEVYLVPDFK